MSESKNLENFSPSRKGLPDEKKDDFYNQDRDSYHDDSKEPVNEPLDGDYKQAMNDFDW